MGILGAGPAAAAAALHLARGGAQVSLYRPARPGEKPCGGALPDYLLRELEGVAWHDLPSIACPAVALENAAGGRVDLEVPGLRLFRRRDLDPALVAAAVAAGARLVERKVERLAFLPEGVEVSASGEAERYEWVVGADGARGLGRRSLELPPEGESVGLGASVTGLAVRRLVLAFPDVADAYLWIFPRPGGASVGAAYSQEGLSHGAARAQLEAFAARHLQAPLASWPGPRYRYPIPVYGPWTVPALRAAARRRMLLVGDAAALADPLTREGIRYALRSGRWAAETLLEGRPGDYPERVAVEMTDEMVRARRARELFFEDPVGQWMVPVCRRHSGVGRVLAELLACRQPYRGLRRRLLGAALRPRPAAAAP